MCVYNVYIRVREEEEGKKTITCLGTYSRWEIIFRESTFRQQSGVLRVLIVHSDLAVVIRWTTALSMQTLSSFFLLQVWMTTELSTEQHCFITVFSRKKGSKCHGGFRDINI